MVLFVDISVDLGMVGGVMKVIEQDLPNKKAEERLVQAEDIA